MAVLDLNADGLKDLLLGRCTGTQVWVSVVPCPWDFDGSGAVGIADLLDLLSRWGKPYGIADLLALLAAWGDCP